MPSYRADLHVHTVLSPCASLEMSPVNIVRKEAEKGIDILGITDHNSTFHCLPARNIAVKEGIFVLTGVEITSREEIHCLAYFETEEQLSEIQSYIDIHLPEIQNDPQTFGYQVIVNEKEEITGEVSKLLISALDQSIEEIEAKVHSLNGLFIPAHIDKSRFSILSQLGFIPDGLKIDALEVSRHAKTHVLQPFLSKMDNKRIITSSDAHLIDDVGSTYSVFELEQRSFAHIRDYFLTPQLIAGQLL